LAASYLLGRFVESVHFELEPSQPRTRAHFQKQHCSSIPIVETVAEKSFGARVLTYEQLRKSAEHALI
jgi:hypothetical protein